jgi:AbrB family looped-hinge helix DNA binding protein
MAKNKEINYYYYTGGHRIMENVFNRTLDELGRIVIPSELRAKLDWGERDILSIQFVDSGTLQLKLSEKYLGQDSGGFTGED